MRPRVVAIAMVALFPFVASAQATEYAYRTHITYPDYVAAQVFIRKTQEWRRELRPQGFRPYYMNYMVVEEVAPGEFVRTMNSAAVSRWHEIPVTLVQATRGRGEPRWLDVLCVIYVKE